MTDDYIRYEPVVPVSDTLLAWQAFAGPRVGAKIEPDPLGPVNKIVTLMVGERRVKSVLCHVPVGAQVTLGRDLGAPLIRAWGPTWQELTGHPMATQAPPRPPGWYVEVDGRRVLEVPEHETYPPRIPPPPVPLHRRLRRALREQWQADTDRIAARLGYYREDNFPEEY